MPLDSINARRVQRLLGRITLGTPVLGDPRVGGDRRKLAEAITETTHDAMGALTVARCILRDASLGSLDGRAEQREAEQAIIAAEHAVMRYREAVLAPHGVKPWEADTRGNVVLASAHDDPRGIGDGLGR